MKNGIWKKICLIATIVGLAILLPASQLLSQDSFREFDRKLVMTPAELHRALSTLHPSKQRQKLDPQRLKEIEKAGRDFLSKLSPEQQENMWEFVEKHLRKNGVDAASSQELLKAFGLPPEMQNELTKQFRKKFSDQRADSDSTPANDSDDGISQLLRKAREKFEEAELGKKGNGQDAGDNSHVTDPSSRSDRSETLNDTDTERRSTKDAQLVPGQAEDSADRERDVPNSAKSNPSGQGLEGEPESPFGQPETESGKRSDGQRPGSQSDSRRASEAGRAGLDTESLDAEKAGDANLDQLLKRLDGLKEKSLGQRKSAGDNGEGNSNPDTPNSDLDWENVIDVLAKKDSLSREKDSSSSRSGEPDSPFSAKGAPATNENGEPASDVAADKNIFGQAQDLISKAFNPNKKSEGNGESKGMASGLASNEKIGSRFDRLLVKAVDRTLASKNDQSVSKGVGGMLGDLMERFQNRASKKANQASETGRGRPERKFDSNQSDPSTNDASHNAIANNSSSRSNSNSAIAPKPSISSADTSSSGSSNIPDLIPDLSGINPTQVFTFFAITGIILFVGYLLTQTLTGNETASRKREVIKRVRNTKIQSPKDLVETVDMFLLAKFGIKSSWWNARLAQRVLHAGSPELQDRVDELFRDYVRARYMRNDIQIPAAEQQRYRKTLEELSMLDIKPDSKLGFVPTPAIDSPVLLEG